MTRFAFIAAAGILVALSGDFARGQDNMKATAADKMTSADQKRIMRACEKQAAQQNVKMDQRAKFVMDCMAKAGK